MIYVLIALVAFAIGGGVALTVAKSRNAKAETTVDQMIDDA